MCFNNLVDNTTQHKPQIKINTFIVACVIAYTTPPTPHKQSNTTKVNKNNLAIIILI